MAKRISVVAGIILSDDSVLIAKRSEEQHQGGLWEFPGGKVELNESNEVALKRELLEELDITLLESQYYQKVDFDYCDKKVSIAFYLILNFSGIAKGVEDQALKWTKILDLEKKEFPQANKAIVDRLIQEYKRKIDNDRIYQH